MTKPDAATSRLRKELGLFDVYALSTGAMFSSGFFLLPGLAAAQTGGSASVAYLVAALVMLPPMLCVAELATAMPKAGGAYYFLDRALGPWVGTVGGLGTWVALVLKSAFALVGLGAYLSIYFDLPIRALAVALAIAFMVINIVGAKETSGLQRALVVTLLGVLAFFIGAGLLELVRASGAPTVAERAPFLTAGIGGFLGTVGFVFVSYAGLTKVASVAEEVVDPDRNIPLGMMLSLATATFVYTVGVYIMVEVIPPARLYEDLTPAATAAGEIPGLSGPIGMAFVVIAALAAFASTGNAGVLSGSRYPLAMARDNLVPPGFARLGRFQTPTTAIVATAGLMILSIVALPIEDLAKLASAFQLLLFSILSLAVVIMRESGIQQYDPGYRSPLYPWLHVTAFIVPLWLIAQMGQLAILFTIGLVAAGTAWYLRYASSRVRRAGAIFHTFARLGELRTPSLDTELGHILREKGLRQGDPFRELVARAAVADFGERVDFDEVIDAAANRLTERTAVTQKQLALGFREELDAGFLPMDRGVALPHLRVDDLSEPCLVLVRTSAGIAAPERSDSVIEAEEASGALSKLRAVFFLLSPSEEHSYHLRLLGHLASVAERDGFIEQWREADGPEELRAALLDQEHLRTLTATPGHDAADWVGVALKDLDLPPATLVAVIRRGERTIVPEGGTIIEEGDAIVVIGEPDVLQQL